MTHSYSTNQIIQYLYNELPALEHLETEYAIENNPEWNNKYHRLKSTMGLLPKVQFFPKVRALKTILQYSKSVV